MANRVATAEEEAAFVQGRDTGDEHPDNAAADAATAPGTGEDTVAKEIVDEVLAAVDTDEATAELSGEEQAEDERADAELPGEDEVDADVADVDADDIDDKGFDDADLVEPLDGFRADEDPTGAGA